MQKQTLAIIPARGGSKRIPRKNIKDFCGKPIISYSISAALESNLFSEVMVSTDDNEIAKIAEIAGASIPFMRSRENSNDITGIAEVILEVLESYQKKDKIFDYVCCILPTAPLINKDILNKSYTKLIDGSFDTVFPIVEFSYPIQRSLKSSISGKVSMVWPENYSARSQDLPPRFHDAGQFYWIKPEKLIKSKQIFTENSGSLLLSELIVQDIDTLADWNICELKYQLMTREK